jgi:hypothetical protein
MQPHVPTVDTLPTVGLTPTQPHKPAGTRPEPAVSVPSAKDTRPAPTATALPLLEPPLMKRLSKGLRGQSGEGVRVPTSPAANWSMLVLPTLMAPAPH